MAGGMAKQRHNRRHRRNWISGAAGAARGSAHEWGNIIMLKEFKEFAMRGNVVDLAVGFILGGAFGTIVKSLVNDVLMPPIGLLLGGVDFSNLKIVLKDGDVAAKVPEVAISYGLFINNVISFVIVSLNNFRYVFVVQEQHSFHLVLMLFLVF